MIPDMNDESLIVLSLLEPLAVWKFNFRGDQTFPLLDTIVSTMNTLKIAVVYTKFDDNDDII